MSNRTPSNFLDLSIIHSQRQATCAQGTRRSQKLENLNDPSAKQHLGLIFGRSGQKIIETDKATKVKTEERHSLEFSINRKKIEVFRKNLQNREYTPKRVLESSFISANQEDKFLLGLDHNTDFQSTQLESLSSPRIQRKVKVTVPYIFPESLKKQLNLKDPAEPFFKVLKTVHKEIMMNHDMFLSQKEQPDAFSTQLQTPQQIINFVQNALLNLLELRKWLKSEIDIDGQISEASFILRQAIQTIGMFAETKDFEAIKQMQSALCLLWTYIVTSLDLTLFKQAELIGEQSSKMGRLVSEQVMAFENNYKHKVNQLTSQKNHLKELNAEQEVIINNQRDQIYELKTNLAEVSKKIDFFKDPSGCQDFRILLENFEKNISYLSREKEKQYKSMRLALRLLEGVEVQRKQDQIEDEKNTTLKQKAISELKKKQVELETQLSIIAQKLTELNLQPDKLFVKIKKPKINTEPTSSKAELTKPDQELPDFEKVIQSLNLSSADEDKLFEAIRIKVESSISDEQSIRNEMVIRQRVKKEVDERLNIQFKEFFLQKKSSAKDVSSAVQEGVFTMVSEFLSLSLSSKLSQKIQQTEEDEGEQNENDYDQEEDDNDSDLSEDFQKSSTKVKKNQVSQDQQETLQKANEMQKLFTSLKEADQNFLKSERQILKKKKGKLQHLFSTDAIKEKMSTVPNQVATRNSTGGRKMIDRKEIELVKNNHIINAIQQTLKQGMFKLTNEHFTCMLPSQIYSLIDTIFQDKVYFDLEIFSTHVTDRVSVSFSSFMYDNVIMQYGLYSISIKVLMQLVNSLITMNSNTPYGYMISQVCGLAMPRLREDEINIILRCHTFFKLVQDQWLSKVKTNPSQFQITAQTESNLESGGDCSIFELLFELKKATKELPQFYQRLFIKLKPDFFYEKEKMNQQNQLEFIILKIVNKIARLGKDIKEIFNSWDINNNGSLDAAELIRGITQGLLISLSREEHNLLAEYLDADRDSNIDFQEFSSKINFKDYQKNSQRYLISMKNFTDRVLNEWYQQRYEEKQAIIEKVRLFDENGDLLIQFAEFDELMKQFEPNVNQRHSLLIFKSAVDHEEGFKEAIDYESVANLIIKLNIGGHGALIFGTYLESKRAKYKEMKKLKKK